MLSLAAGTVHGVEDQIGTARDLLFELRTEKRTYSLYEPVVLTYSVLNPTESTIIASVVLKSPDHVVIWISRAGGDRVRFPFGRVLCIAGQSHHPPGEEMAEELPIFWNRRKGLVFPEPGSYRITASVQVRRGIVVEAQPVEIEVIEPPEVDRRAMEALGGAERLQDLLRGEAVDYCDEADPFTCILHLRSTLRSHHSSSYVPHIVYVLMNFAFHPGAAKGLGVELGREFLQWWPEHGLAPKVLLRLISKGPARESWIDQFEARCPKRKQQVESLRYNWLGRGR
jgi:hypothetical protein